MPAVWTSEWLRSLSLQELQKYAPRCRRDQDRSSIERGRARRLIEELERRKERRPVTKAEKKPAAFSGTEVSDAEISRIMATLGKRGGKIGGKARAAVLTPEQRSNIASKAARARWNKAAADASKK